MKPAHAASRRSVLFTLAAGALSTRVSAQEWAPTRPLQIIIPYPPGGVDAVLNPILPTVSQRLGQPVVLLHRPGASTIIGMQALASAQPDGHTIGVLTDQTVLLQLENKLPYKVSELVPVTQLVEGTFVVAAGQNRGFGNLREFIAAAKANPGKYSYASTGNGSPHHVMMEGLSQAAGIQLSHIPYQGSSQMITDVIGGHVDLLLLGAVTAVEQIKAGKLIALGVLSASRLPGAPEIPTISEAGLPGFASSYWYALAAPRGTPLAAAARLNREIVAALNMPEARQQLVRIHMTPKPSSPAELAALMKRDEAKYTDIMTRAKMRFD